MEELSDPSQLAVVVVAKPVAIDPNKSQYEGNITIPSKIEHDLDTYNVIGIAKNAFNSDEIESLVIPDGITQIAPEAINSQSLKKLSLPNSIEYLIDVNCPSLEEINFGTCLKKISGLVLGPVKSLKFPDSIEELSKISQSTKIHRASLDEIDFGSNVKKIEQFTIPFAGSTLIIPGSCISISDSFPSCDELSKLKLEEGIEEIINSFDKTRELEYIIFPRSCKSIFGSFNKNSLDEIGFKTGLQEIVSSFSTYRGDEIVFPNSLKIINDSFQNLNLTETLKFGSGVQEIKNSFDQLKKMDELTIPGNCKVIEGSFNNCSFSHLNLEKGIEEIVSSFINYPAEELKIPDSVTVIEESFQNDPNLKRLLIANSVKTIKDSFDNMDNVQQVIFGKGWSKINTLNPELFVLKEGQKRLFEFPWNEVVKLPGYICSIFDTGRRLIIMVPIEMMEEYNKAFRFGETQEIQIRGYSRGNDMEPGFNFSID